MELRNRAVRGIREVVDGELCIGCGACTAVSDAAVIGFNHFGELVADIGACSDAEISAMDDVCPFSDEAPNETQLAQRAFAAEKNALIGEEIGLFTGLYAGYSATYRKWGSSGGIVTWVLHQLLAKKLVDKVIVVGKSGRAGRFFDFKILGDVDELRDTGTSFYYPVSYDGALRYISENPGRYAITGVPCFHKALRRLKRINPIMAERIRYQVGIVCGQMKSAFYLDFLSRKAGADSPLVSACFRRKDESARADDYLFEATFLGASGVVEERRVRNRVVGANWAMGLFKPRACDFCDDVFAETADMAVMDAWLDRYVTDGKGTSLIVTRSSELQALLEAGRATGELCLETVCEDDVVESQRGGLNHRRAGLRYRLFLAGQHGPVPRKRVHPDNGIDIWFKIEQRLRSSIRSRSRLAMLRQLESGCGGLGVYESEMGRLLQLYKWFARVRSRLSGHTDYRPLFRLDGPVRQNSEPDFPGR